MKVLLRMLHHFPLLTGAAILIGLTQIFTTWILPIREQHPYDTIVHFVFSALAAAVTYLAVIDFHLLSNQSERKALFSAKRTVLMCVFIGTTIGVWWEMLEFFQDVAFGKHLQYGNTDTMVDLIADSCGSLLGGWVLVFLSHRRRQVGTD